MSSNLYGVANAPGAPNGVGIGSDIACPAGSETNVIVSGVIIAPTPGWFSVLINGVIGLALGATLPTSINLGVRFSGGSDIVSWQFVPTNAPASSTFVLPVNFALGPYSSQWQSPGSVLQVTISAGTNAVTAKQFGCFAYFTLLRAPDQ